MYNDIIALTQKLISYQSVTPFDNGCQAFIKNYLEKLGFHVTQMKSNRVDNLWGYFGQGGPLIVFAGHTDVVPIGHRESWDLEPFAGEIVNNKLYGRGCADMKGSIAAFLIAVQNLLTEEKTFQGSIGIMLTSGEESDECHDGTPEILKYLSKKNINIDCCIIGEPTSQAKLGDTIKIGRRGSLSGQCHIKGHEKHIAYATQQENLIHNVNKAIVALNKEIWDKESEHFPATQLQFTKIQSISSANNVTPATCDLHFNFRYSNLSTEDTLKSKTQAIFDAHDLDYDVQWFHSGKPYFSKLSKYVELISSIIYNETQIQPKLCTGGGTSDGRFIAEYAPTLFELGLIQKTIHQPNEHTDVADLTTLSQIYLHFLREAGKL